MVSSPCRNSSGDQTSVTSTLQKLAKATESRTSGALSSLIVIKEHLGKSQRNRKMRFNPSRRARGSSEGRMRRVSQGLPTKNTPRC